MVWEMRVQGAAIGNPQRAKQSGKDRFAQGAAAKRGLCVVLGVRLFLLLGGPSLSLSLLQVQSGDP